MAGSRAYSAGQGKYKISLEHLAVMVTRCKEVLKKRKTQMRDMSDVHGNCPKELQKTKPGTI